MNLDKLIERVEILKLALETCISVHSMTFPQEDVDTKHSDQMSQNLLTMFQKVGEIHQLFCMLRDRGTGNSTESQEVIERLLKTLFFLEKRSNDLIEQERQEILVFRIAC